MKYFTCMFLFACMFLTSCEKEDFCNCLKGEGTTVTEERTIPEFTSIEMSSNVDVILKSGTVPGVMVTCGENLADGIQTEVRDGVLYIDNLNKCNWLRDLDNKFTVTVTYTQLRMVTNRGPGLLQCADTLRSPVFQVDNWNSSGTVSLVLNCEEVYFKLHTGPADIEASGKCGYLYIYSAGNGFVKASALSSDRCSITTKSTGDCEVSVKSDLEVYIEYDGDVYYNGNPSNIYSEITGKGKLIPF